MSMPRFELQSVAFLNVLIPWINHGPTAEQILLQGIFLQGFRAAAFKEFCELLRNFLFEVRLVTDQLDSAGKIGMFITQLPLHRSVVDGSAESIVQPGLVIAKSLQDAFPNIVDGIAYEAGNETIDQLNQLVARRLKGRDKVIALERDTGFERPCGQFFC
jgi:hypothetical protein